MPLIRDEDRLSLTPLEYQCTGQNVKRNFVALNITTAEGSKVIQLFWRRCSKVQSLNADISEQDTTLQSSRCAFIHSLWQP